MPEALYATSRAEGQVMIIGALIRAFWHVVDIEVETLRERIKRERRK